MATQGTSRGRLTEEKAEELMRATAKKIVPQVNALARKIGVHPRNVVWGAFKLTSARKGGERMRTYGAKRKYTRRTAA